jgi:hypothetical protein
MTLARLLAAALVLCSLSAFAQNQQPPKQSDVATGKFSPPLLFDTAATPSEPWKFGPDKPRYLRFGQNALDTKRLSEGRLDQIKSDPPLRLKVETLDADATCYRIRTYVVARDSKDSDSTHPAGYSTCQPSAQYQLKTTVLRSVSPPEK